MELTLIVLDPHVIPHFDANELLYAFVFHTCDFDNHSLYNCHLNRSNLINTLILLLHLTLLK